MNKHCLHLKSVGTKGDAHRSAGVLLMFSAGSLLLASLVSSVKSVKITWCT